MVMLNHILLAADHMDQIPEDVQQRLVRFLNAVDAEAGHVKQKSQSSGIRPPSRPEKPTVSMPISRAACKARLTLADLPLVEMPSAMSPARPSIRNCCDEGTGEILVVADGGEHGRVGGQRHRRQGRPLLDDRVHELDGNVGRVAGAAAVAHDEQAGRRRRSFRAMAVQQSAIRSAFSAKNCSLVAMLSRHLRRIMPRCSAKETGDGDESVLMLNRSRVPRAACLPVQTRGDLCPQARAGKLAVASGTFGHYSSSAGQLET